MRTRRLAGFTMAAIMSTGVINGADALQLDKKAATAKAVEILLGDPYGRSAAAVRANLHGTVLITSGATECGPVSRPVWQFLVAVPASRGQSAIAGHLYINADSGEMECAGLPFLD